VLKPRSLSFFTIKFLFSESLGFSIQFLRSSLEFFVLLVSTFHFIGPDYVVSSGPLRIESEQTFDQSKMSLITFVCCCSLSLFNWLVHEWLRSKGRQQHDTRTQCHCSPPVRLKLQDCVVLGDSPRQQRRNGLCDVVSLKCRLANVW
jgi:hypothetical protein